MRPLRALARPERPEHAYWVLHAASKDAVGRGHSRLRMEPTAPRVAVAPRAVADDRLVPEVDGVVAGSRDASTRSCFQRVDPLAGAGRADHGVGESRSAQPVVEGGQT